MTPPPPFRPGDRLTHGHSTITILDLAFKSPWGDQHYSVRHSFRFLSFWFIFYRCLPSSSLESRILNGWTLSRTPATPEADQKAVPNA
jgi:hypothetical protein